MKHIHHITNSLAVDHFARVKLADLSYSKDSQRPDDCGSLYIAPIVAADWDVTPGLIALYATTNGDSILLGLIEHGDLTWVEPLYGEGGLNDAMIEVLSRAAWDHPRSGEGYSYLVADAGAEAAKLS